jgi:hypothetical protein
MKAHGRQTGPHQNTFEGRLIFLASSVGVLVEASDPGEFGLIDRLGRSQKSHFAEESTA